MFKHRVFFVIAFAFALAFADVFMPTVDIARQASSAHAENSQVAVVRTGVYTYKGQGTVNTHWIETPGGGLVVIDVQRDLVHAREALAAVRAVGKPVRAILITHGHPDHYTGLGIFKQAFPDAVVYASAVTENTIRTDSYGYNAAEQKDAPEITPREFAVPGRILEGDVTLTIDGLVLIAREMGRAEANSVTAYYAPASRDLYVGDLVMNRVHAFMGEGATGEWLAALDRVDAMFPNARVVHPGHGDSGAKQQLLTDQREYLRTVRGFAAEEIARSGFTAAAKTATARRINERFRYINPTGNADIVALGVDGLFQEFSRPTLTPIP